MSTLSQFAGGGGIKPNGLLNGASVLQRDTTQSGVLGSKVLTTGAQTAGVLATALSLSGKGCIDFLSACSTDATTRTHRLKVTLDGVVIFDATSSVINTANHQHIAIGGRTAIVDASSNSYVVGQPLNFDSSLLVEYASSLSETGGSKILVRYTPRA